MLVAKTFLVAAILANFASAENHSRTLRMRKPRDNAPDYFEQCRYVNIWKEQLGYVIVLAFLSPLWQYSVRQAVLLKLLGMRLRKSGLQDIRFFVITPPPDIARDIIEEDFEIQAWSEIPMFEPENLALASQHILKDDGWEMIVIQDNSQLRMWQRFRASNNQIVIIDRCGKLTYQVMVPWSILYFPYVKAAILSTYREDPCGACDPAAYKTLLYKEYFSNVRNDSDKDPPRNDDINDDLVRGHLENVEPRLNESLAEEYEASTVSTFSDTSDGTTYLDSSSVTEVFVESENAYQHNGGTTESSLDKDNANVGEMWYQSTPASVEENVKNLENTNVSDVFPRPDDEKSEGAGSFESQKNVFPKEEELSTFINTENSDVNYGNETKLVLPEKSVDEVQSKSVTNVAVETTPLALRIIMYAPHVHKNGKDTKKHTHLILKTDSSNYHGHLNTETNVVTSPSNLWQYSEEYTHDRKTEAGIELDAYEEDPDNKYTYEKDERPGLYGEVADYWRNYEEKEKDDDITDKNETSNNYDFTDNVESDEVTSVKMDNSNHQVNEEEIRNKLIKHYNKLLPWIHFILNK